MHKSTVLCSIIALFSGGCGPVVRLLGWSRKSPAFGSPHQRDVASDVVPPSGHTLHLTSGTADMAMWSDCNSHTVVAHNQSCVEVLGKPLISRRFCPPSSDGYLVERES